jgi:hypothetical protein
MDRQHGKVFQYRAVNGVASQHSLELLVDKELAPKGKDSETKRLKERMKIVSSKDTMRLCKMFWN